jgi:arylsulfatase
MDINGPAPRLANKSFTITAYAGYRNGDEGVLLSAGVNVGGYVLYIEDGRLKFHFNYLDERFFQIDSHTKIDTGNHTFAFDFVTTHPDKGVGRLLVDGKPAGAVAIGVYPLFAVAGGIAVGRYPTSPVQHTHKGKGYFKYTGVIDRIEYELERPTNDMDLMLELERELAQS